MPMGHSGSSGLLSDVIFSARRGNSQKPSEVYELVEQLVPSGGFWVRHALSVSAVWVW